MKKTNLVLFPVLVALLLAGCTTGKKSRRRRSSSGEGSETSEVTSTPTSTPTSKPTSTPTSTPTSKPTSTPTSQPTSTPTSQPTSTPTSGITPIGDDSFDLTPGEHVTTLDFVTKSATYKESFPKVEATTGLYTVNLAGLDCNGVGCYCGSYNNLGYLFMRNKDNFASNHGHAFIANTVSLGNISSIVFQPGSGGSAFAQYNIAILSSPVSTEGGSSAGTTFTGTGGTVTGSGGYFCITQLLDSVNGQIGTLTITYTIS